MKRTSLVTSTAALLAGGGLVLAVSAAGTASPADRGDSHRLAFTAHTLASAQSGSNHLLESDKAVKSGTIIGYTANSCTFDFDAGVAHCLVTLARPQGQLRARVTVNAQTGHSTGRIVGGSGAYRGARGTISGDQASPDAVRITMRWTD